MAEFATKGVAGSGLGLGIAGTALGLLNGGLGGILGTPGMDHNHGYGYGMCSENTPVNRFELQQEQKIATLESQIALRDAQVYTDGKIIEATRYLDTKIESLDSKFQRFSKDVYDADKAQAVFNEKVTGKLSEVATIVAVQGRTLDSITFSAVNENRICSPNCNCF